MSTTSKTNGAKSQGPITPEGKAKSAANSLRHGLTAKAVVLPTESQEDYEALLAAHVERFQPADPIEMDLVESMAVARWRLRRITNIETHLLSNEMDAAEARDAANLKPKDHDQRLAQVFERSNRSLTLMMRYEIAFHRTFDRALRQLQLLQKARVLPDVGSFGNTVEYRAVQPTCAKNSSTSPSPAPPSQPSPSPKRAIPLMEPGTETGPPPPPSELLL